MLKDVARHNKMNKIKFDEFNCYGLEPETSLTFLEYFGIRHEIDYRFVGFRTLILVVRNIDVIIKTLICFVFVIYS